MTELEEKLAAWQADPRFVAIAGQNTAWETVAAKYGLALYEAGEIETAAVVFQVACDHQPLKPFNWSNLGVALSELGRADEAIMAFNKSLALNPKQGVVQFNLAQILSRLGRLEEAHQAFACAGQDPELTQEAMLHLGLMYMTRLDYTKAIDAFRAALARFPQAATFHANLGAVLFQTANLEGALDAYGKAALLENNSGYRENSSFISMLIELIKTTDETGITAYRQEHPKISLADALKRAVFYLTTYRHFPAAKVAAQAWAAEVPDDPEAGYLSQALASVQLERAPADYLRRHFDDYAAIFDAALLNHLQYQVPDEIERLLQDRLEEDFQGWVLDLGCGTGLLAERLRPFATHLTGLDISPRMLEIARAKNVYDELLLGDLAALPMLTKDKFDLIVASDVLIYFGDLVNPFAAIAEALRPGGWFVVSLELMPGRHYFLMPNGRFKHAHVYLEQVRRTHFMLVEKLEVPIRVEAGYPVPGTVLLFRKRP